MRTAIIRNFSTIITALFLSLSINATEAKGQKPSSAFRVISYNIWIGFKVNPSRKAKLDPARLKLAKQWIAAKNPDVVALQELNGFSEQQLAVMAKTWGHEYVKLCNSKSAYNVGITSKTPLSNISVYEERNNNNPYMHGLIIAQTRGVDFVVLHHNPFKTKDRLHEQQHILNQVEILKQKSTNIILLGDFNSRSQADGKGDTVVMDNYHAAGLDDLVSSKGKPDAPSRGSFPTAILKKGYQASGRIDYILATPPWPSNVFTLK
ncbi:endonuclease/exonuclease/phosphatase family protein [Lentisphaera profundi]|uniref:Endonuclease/exonuclease/phosphatase family protein n=1 Tax=Lentisphaera profundi TaxID=1658616 RepID=A0ABY7W4Q4_9BACT|nr:endonuclease/exonuclease/phosphatase family protein [Lentisphaera profundi]WDE99223.1 endonuclease/exonuclease/phosphatase family protein [Lentisphaera profundi]